MKIFSSTKSAAEATRTPKFTALRRSLQIVLQLLPLMVLEALGRTSNSDWMDAVGVLLMLTFASLWLRGRDLAELKDRLRPTAQRLIDFFQVDLGVDLRGTPALETRLPRAFLALVITSLCLGGGLAAGAAAFPSDLREVLRSMSGALYLLYVGLLWTALLLGALFWFSLPLFWLHSFADSELRFRSPEKGRREGEPRGLRSSAQRQQDVVKELVPQLVMLTGCVYLTVLVFSGWKLQTGGWYWPLALSGCVCALSFVVAPARGLRMIWSEVADENRAADLADGASSSGSRVMYWMPLDLLMGGTIVALTCLACVPLLLSCGDRLVGRADEATSLTAALGVVYLWPASLSGAFLLLLFSASRCLSRWHDPARLAPVRVGLRGIHGFEQGIWKRALEAVGLRARFLEERQVERGCDLVFQPGFGGESQQGTDAQASPVIKKAQTNPWVWPPHTSESTKEELRLDQPEDLGDKQLVLSLERTAELRRRRELLRVLKRLFKAAAAREKAEAEEDEDQGSGFWVAPHLWFVSNLSRDQQEEPWVSNSPPYRRVLSRQARNSLFRVLRDQKIDLIFVEDGVSFRRFARVLRALFEFHDLFGARRLEDSQIFMGLPGVRVIIHEHPEAQTFNDSKYPEPDWEEVGRARVLHVFKDRGDDVEDVLSPVAEDPVLEPVLV